MRKFPTDIFAVKEYGITRWQEEFFLPVSDEKYLEMYQDVDRCIEKAINGTPADVANLLSIDAVYLSIEYANVLHALKVIDVVGKNGIELFCTGNSLWYKKITDKAPLDNHMYNIFPTYTNLSSMNIKARISERLKSLAKTVIFNRFDILKYVVSLFEKENLRICGSNSPLIDRYIKETGRWCYFTSFSDWLKGNSNGKISDELAGLIKDCADGLIDNLSQVAAKYDVPFPDGFKSHLANLTKNRFINTGKTLNRVERVVRTLKKKTHFLLSGTGIPLNRVIGVAVQKQGGKIAVFAHGGDVGLLNQPLYSISSFDAPIVNDFVTYTNESAGLYEMIKRNHLHCDSKWNMVSAESNEYFMIWKRYRNLPPADTIKSVMVIGSPHYHRRVAKAGGLSLTRLDYELRFIDVLKETDYRVIYKAHPERLSEIEGIFEGKAEVMKEKLEKDFNCADAFIFPRITTSTFMKIVCTNKRIIILDISFKDFKPFEEPLELLEKRCSVIETWRDKRGRVLFDKKHLLEELTRKPKYPNTEFMEKYLFPANIKSVFTEPRRL